MDQFVQAVIIGGITIALIGTVMTVGGDSLMGDIDDKRNRLDVLKDRASESLSFVHGGVVYPHRVLTTTYVMPPGGINGASQLVQENATVMDVANNGIGSVCISEILLEGEEMHYVILKQDIGQYHFNPQPPTQDDAGCYEPGLGGQNNKDNNVIEYGTITRIVLVEKEQDETDFRTGTGVGAPLMDGVPCERGDDIRIITTAGNVFVTSCAGGFE